MKDTISKKQGNRWILVFTLCLLFFAPSEIQSQSSLSQLLEATMAQLATMPPTERGPGWQRWEVSGRPWDAIGAFTGENTPEQQPGLLVAMKDTLPLLALFADGKNQRYQYIKIDKSLAKGWSMVARVSGEDGLVGWVEMSREGRRAIVAGQPGKAIPQFLILPEGRDSCLILSWDASGEAFENILLYSQPERSVTACAPFALNPSAMDYLFLKGEGDTWVEYTFRSERTEPVAIAIHNKVPGNLSKAAWDLNQDGRMDLLGEFSPTAPQATYRKVEGAPSTGNSTQAEAMKQRIATRARNANALWLEAQWAWWKLQPLEVELPEVAAY